MIDKALRNRSKERFSNACEIFIYALNAIDKYRHVVILHKKKREYNVNTKHSHSYGPNI